MYSNLCILGLGSLCVAPNFPSSGGYPPLEDEELLGSGPPPPVNSY